MKKFLLLGIICFVGISPLYAFTKEASLTLEEDLPTLLRADTITVDHDLGLIKARGNVEIYRGERKLKADLITYSQQTNVVTASGNVVLFEISGEEVFSNYAELSGDLKEGIIKEIRIVMADDARFAAATAKRFEGNKTQVERAVFSPCKICKAQPDKAPLWQLKAQTALWDTDSHDIIYTDAVMEMFGIPVFYTPYFRHPDPTVKRRSGLLSPSLGSSPTLGSFVNIPYYFVLSSDKDLTLSPLFTTEGGEFMGGEYRQRLKNGTFAFVGSVGQAKKIVQPKKQERKTKTRWHIDETLHLNFNKNWRGGVDVVRASDQTYLRQYPFYGHTSKSILKSTAFAEGFYNRSYASIEGLSFQGLREADIQKTTPLILPMVNINYLSHPGVYGSRWTFDGNFLSLTRQKGTDTRRFSSKGSFQVPYVSPFGDVYVVDLSLRGDVYHTNHFVPLLNNKEINETRGRVFPQVMLDWHYPFFKSFDTYNIVIAPAANLIGAPKVKKQERFPNEDSIILEPNDLSLLQASRFPGLDIIDDGSRIDYGLKAATTMYNFGRGNIFVGQTHAFQKPSMILHGTGFGCKSSDYIGRVELDIGSYINFHYRFRIDTENLVARRNELDLRVGQPILQLGVDYIKLPRYLGETDSVGGEQIALSVSSQFVEDWTGIISTTRELSKKTGSLAHSAGLKYTDECFEFETLITKSFYRDRDLKPGMGFLFRLMFKTLGEFSHSSTIGARERSNPNATLEKP
ncbi:MAG: LPS-assembly protein LptD [Alphaproteobacteria bacterium]|nr:LPS-assembly protein LptD [Alphaproteobacteria bacterium]